MIQRKNTKEVFVRDLPIGSDNKIVIQSMTNTKTSDYLSTIEQIKRLENEKCELVRVSVPDEKSATAISKIRSEVSIPIVADIHFNYRLALMCAENGIDALRINPGNIGGEEKVKQVAKKASEYKLPIRIGVNMGSLEKSIENRYGRTPHAMVKSALYNIKLLEKYDFYDIVVSMKASNVIDTIKSYEEFSEICDYPLHVGITESGTVKSGTVKSSMGIGYLLLNGIGDTIRVSLTADPIEEVRVAKLILENIGYNYGIKVISCPTCARTNIDIIGLAEKVEKHVSGIKKSLTVAVMGCAVNGPGEAKDADIGITGGNGDALIFAKGKILKKVKEEELLDELTHLIDKM